MKSSILASEIDREYRMRQIYIKKQREENKNKKDKNITKEKD